MQWENEHVWQENQTLMADLMWIMSIMQSYWTCSNHVCTAPSGETKDRREKNGTKSQPGKYTHSLLYHQTYLPHGKAKPELKESSKNTDQWELFQDYVSKIFLALVAKTFR